LAQNKKKKLDLIKMHFYALKFYEKNGFIYSEVFMEDSIGGKDVRELLYFLA